MVLGVKKADSCRTIRHFFNLQPFFQLPAFSVPFHLVLRNLAKGLLTLGSQHSQKKGQFSVGTTDNTPMVVSHREPQP